MTKRRQFLQLTSFGLLSTSIGIPLNVLAQIPDPKSTVKELKACERFYVRENTAITIHLSKEKDGIQSPSLCSEKLLPGSVIPIHKHLYADEYFFFISGSGLITIEDKEFAFSPGTSGFVLKNTWHSVKNTGDEPVFFQFGYSPAGFEDFFRQIGTPDGQPFKPKAKSEVDAAAKQFGMVYK